jgi:hypothetical protein
MSPGATDNQTNLQRRSVLSLASMPRHRTDDRRPPRGTGVGCGSGPGFGLPCVLGAVPELTWLSGANGADGRGRRRRNRTAHSFPLRLRVLSSGTCGLRPPLLERTDRQTHPKPSQAKHDRPACCTVGIGCKIGHRKSRKPPRDSARGSNGKGGDQHQAVPHRLSYTALQAAGPSPHSGQDLRSTKCGMTARVPA